MSNWAAIDTEQPIHHAPSITLYSLFFPPLHDMTIARAKSLSVGAPLHARAAQSKVHHSARQERPHGHTFLHTALVTPYKPRGWCSTCANAQTEDHTLLASQ
jgi:hypothetical protein